MFILLMKSATCFALSFALFRFNILYFLSVYFVKENRGGGGGIIKRRV